MIKLKSYLYLKVLGYLFAVPGLIFISVGIAGFFENSPDRNDQILGGLVFGGIAVLGGIILIYVAYNKEKKSKMRYAENVVYSLAKANNGILNSYDLSIFTGLPEIECEEMLNDFVTKGHSIPEVNEKGYVEYKFPVFQKV